MIDKNFFHIDFKRLKKQISKVDLNTQKKVLEKLEQIQKEYPNTNLLKKLNNHQKATHSIKIGKYRILILIENLKKQNNIYILDFGHRKDIYQTS